MAGRAHGLTFDDDVTELFCQVCFAAPAARANVNCRRVGVFDFHVVCLSMLLVMVAPGSHADR